MIMTQPLVFLPITKVENAVGGNAAQRCTKGWLDNAGRNPAG